MLLGHENVILNKYLRLLGTGECPSFLGRPRPRRIVTSSMAYCGGENQILKLLKISDQCSTQFYMQLFRGFSALDTSNKIGEKLSPMIC